MNCIDLLGEKVKTINCAHKTEGLVVGESRNALYIWRDGRTAIVPKAPCDFLLLGTYKIVRGKDIIGYRDVRLLGDRCLSVWSKGPTL